MSASQQILLGNAPAAAGGYQISRSLRFNSADSAYLNRTPASAGNRKTWTWSGWVKRSALGSSQFLFDATSGVGTRLYFSSGDAIQFDSGGSGVFTTSQVFRDVSSWYHIVFVADTTQATASNRIKLYVNGSQVTAFSATSYPTQNTDTDWNNTVSHYLGRNGNASVSYLNGYLTEIHSIDGQALDPTSFGEYNSNTGVWQPKAYAGTYGTNGFYLNFSDNSNTTAATLGKDYSGNGNNWTPNNFSVTAGAGNDSLVDTPTPYGTDTGVGGEVRGNYATINAVDKNSQIALANGNLDYTNSSSNANTQARATIAYSSTGKWYFESTRGGGGSSFAAGIGTSTTSLGTQNAGIIMYNQNGQIYVDGVLNSTPGTTFASGDTMGVAVDMDAAKVYWYKNGVVINASGLSFTVGSSTWMPMIGCYTNGDTGTLNFGQRPFAYTPPAGFKSLCTTNLPEPTILDGGDYFNAVLYTGNGTSDGNQQAITGVGFSPDLVWLKSRSNATGNYLADQVRGVNKTINSNNTNAEQTQTIFPAFGADGFTVEKQSANDGVNVNGYTYVAWNWKANGAGSSNTAGTITSTVSASQTAGFSVVTYTGNGTAGATIGHGLGATPSMMIAKNRSSGGSASYEWTVYHASLGATKAVFLNDTGAAATDAGYWYNTAPTSTLITVPSNTRTNTNGSNFVIYCFAAIAGFSAFGSITGNGSTDGPFCYLGFRPAFIMLKRTDSTGNWTILDFKRAGYNVDNDQLYPNLSNAEATTDLADLLSNGFKLRSTDTSVNASGGTYVYAAFSENPFKYSLAR